MRKFIFIILVPFIFISCKQPDNVWYFSNESSQDLTISNDINETFSINRNSQIKFLSGDFDGTFYLVNAPYNINLIRTSGREYKIKENLTTFSYTITNLNDSYDIYIFADDKCFKCAKNSSINITTYDNKSQYKFYFKTGVDANNNEILASTSSSWCLIN